MKYKNCQFTPKKRRGLSSVVGALLFVVLMVSAFSMFGVALDNQGETGKTAKMVANADLKKQQEDFTINIFTDGAQLLTVDVRNIGQNAVEIPTLIITNSSDIANGFPTIVYDLQSDTSFVGPGYTGNVVSTTPITLGLADNPGDTKLYHFKVISSRGTIKTTTVSCDDLQCGAISTGGGGLTATLFLDGPNGVNTKTSTVVMFVSNTADVAITDVQPTKGFSSPFCDDLWIQDDSAATETLFVEDVDPCVVSPSTPITLDPHATTLFKWDGTILGDVGSVFTFCSDVSGMHPEDGFITGGGLSCDSLTIIDPNDCNGCGLVDGGETIILLDDLLNRPSVFLTIPSPFGDTTAEKGIWGINVANPTNTVIEVPRVVLTAFIPGANDNMIMFDIGGTCGATSVGSASVPAVSQNWACDQTNVVVWQNYALPIVLQPYTVQSFLAKINPGSSGNTEGDSSSLVITSNVFSTFGTFGKSGYQSTMLGGSTQKPGLIANVYLSPDVNGFADNKIETTRMNIAENSTQNFNIVLTDFDQDDTHAIGINTKLIINVPRDWTNVGLDSCVGFEDVGTASVCDGPNEPVITLHDDGSYQIIGTTMELIGKIDDAVDSRTISFHADAPDVNTERMYVMYVLASGLTDVDNAPIGPLSEIILHVLP